MSRFPAFLLLAVGSAPGLAIDWPAFMRKQDLVWEETPRQWNEGGFIGNGQLGAMVYATLADNRLDFHLGRVDVTDHRGAPDRQTSFGVPDRNVMYDFPRLDIGRLALRPAGRIEAVSMRLDLWNAELRGEVATDLRESGFPGDGRARPHGANDRGDFDRAAA